ncbi:MAG: hypothetical protein ISS72_05205 [Candidatus Brocadiae bacterium]|nr:hypothetical protein [Candidatus Brocadiia bacterium]
MPGGRSPEEFFEVFREVQNKARADEAESQEALDSSGAADEAATPEPSWFGGAPVVLSRSALLIGSSVVLLALLCAYMVAWQRGWRAREALLHKPAAQKGAKATPAKAPPPPGEPELVDGKVFTLLSSGKRPELLASVKQEVEYLNGYAPFRALGLRAYAYTDRQGRHRVCANGFAAMSREQRDAAKKAVRGLKSRRGSREYSSAEFYSP